MPESSPRQWPAIRRELPAEYLAAGGLDRRGSLLVPASAVVGEVDKLAAAAAGSGAAPGDGMIVAANHLALKKVMARRFALNFATMDATRILVL